MLALALLLRLEPEKPWRSIGNIRGSGCPVGTCLGVPACRNSLAMRMRGICPSNLRVGPFKNNSDIGVTFLLTAPSKAGKLRAVMKNLIKIPFVSRASLKLATLLCLTVLSTAYSANYSWNSTTESAWSNAVWSPSGPPGAGDSVIDPLQFGNAVPFNANATIVDMTLSNLTSGWTIRNTNASERSLTMTGNLSKAGAGNLVFTNAGVTQKLNVAVNGTFINSSGNTLIGNFGAGQDINSFTVGGLTTISGGVLLTRGSNTAIAFNGGLSISAGGQVSSSGIAAAASGTTGFTTSSLTGAGILRSNNGATAFSSTVVINGGAGSSTFSGQLTNGAGGGTGTLAISKSGNSTQIFTGTTNNYTGGTVVNAGTLLVNNASGSGLGAGDVTVNGGILGGTGGFTGAVTVNSGGTLSPGSSIESLATGSNIWNGGGALTFEFSTDGSTGAAGSQWDLLAITGGLDLSGASSGNRFVLNLVTMSNASTPGVLAAWDPNVDHTWSGFVTTTTGFTGFSTDKFSFNTSGFQNSLNGSFSVSQNGNNLDLIYTVPEPATWALLAGSMTVVTILRRRRRVE